MTMTHEISKLMEELEEIKMKMEEREERSIRETEKIWRRLERTENETHTQTTLHQQHEKEICNLRIKMEKNNTELTTKMTNIQMTNCKQEELTANLFPLSEIAAKVNSLESRLASLESAVNRAVDSSFPRLEALLAKMAIVQGEEAEDSITLSPSVDSDPELGKAIIEAAKEGDAKEVHRLLLDGVNILHKDCDGWSALHYAAYSGQVETAAALLHSGADVDSRTALGATPLHCAAFAGHWPLVQLLLRHGASANSTDNIGRSPLHDAVSNAHTHSVRLLLDAGADPTTESLAGNKPLDYSVNQVIRTLLQNEMAKPGAK